MYLEHVTSDCLQEFKHDFYPGEHIFVTCRDGSRAPAVIREKTKFPELRNTDGSLDRASFARYFVCYDSLPDQESIVDTANVARDRKTFTKQRLRSFLKKTIDHEPWSGAPWCVKTKIAEEYRISVKVPQHLTYESQIAQRKANMAIKKGDYEGQILNFPSNLPQLKPKGQKSKNGIQDLARLSNEYQRALAANPDFSKIPQAIQQQQIEQMIHGPNGFPPFAGFQPIAAKGKPKPPPPPPPKYPIEDLELPPAHNGITRPPMKFLSTDIPTYEQPSESREGGIMVQSVGRLLETWDTLNVYCEVFQLDSFTFDNYVESLQLGSNILHCDLIVEIHCAILKKLVNDSNDKNGQIQFSLPELAVPDSETTSNADNSNVHTPIPEPEVRSSGRTTRSSLAKSEAAEMRETNKIGEPSTMDLKIHRAADMAQTTSGNDWKNLLRKRDLSEGKWVFIIVGLLYQLSSDSRRKNKCDDILARLAPLDQEPVPETAISQYATIDINTRVKILEIICMLSLETKAIRNYMEECNNHMTETRKERIEVQRTRKAAYVQMYL